MVTPALRKTVYVAQWQSSPMCMKGRHRFDSCHTASFSTTQGTSCKIEVDRDPGTLYTAPHDQGNRKIRESTVTCAL
jgi:hypothetical protein